MSIVRFIPTLIFAVAAQVVIVPWAYGLELARLELERRGCGVDNLPDLTSRPAPVELEPELERAA